MVDLLGGSFLGDALIGGDAAVSDAPEVHIHGVATVTGDLTVTNPGGMSGTINGQATCSGSLGISKAVTGAAHGTGAVSGTLAVFPPSLHTVIQGVARVGGSLTERRLLIPVLVGIRTLGLSLSASGGVAKANTETQGLDTALDPSGGLSKRALNTYFT